MEQLSGNNVQVVLSLKEGNNYCLGFIGLLCM